MFGGLNMTDIAGRIMGNVEKRKISFDIDKKTLEAIDELAKLTKSPRNVVIMAALWPGVKSFTEYLKKSWTEMTNKEKNEKAEVALEKLAAIKKKWQL